MPRRIFGIVDEVVREGRAAACFEVDGLDGGGGDALRVEPNTAEMAEIVGAIMRRGLELCGRIEPPLRSE